jgi:PAS domain-containing protein
VIKANRDQVLRCLPAEEQGLFEEVAGDLAFALHKIEMAERLRKGERRYREIFEGSRDGFVMVDSSGRDMHLRGNSI